MNDNNSKHRTVLTLRNIANKLSIGGRFKIPQSILRRFFRHAHGVVHVRDFDGSLEINLRLSEHMQRRIFWMGYYNNSIVALMNEVLVPGMTVIDIGANIGEITMVAAKRVGAIGKVVAFEPIDAVADALSENIRRNRLDQVNIVRSGLSDTVKDAVPVYESCSHGHASDENCGLGSLYGEKAGGAFLQNIALTTLDEWLRINPLTSISLMKIDIEGSELPCLRGAEQTLRRFMPMLIVEIQDESATAAGYRARDILDFLSSIGYAFSAIGDHGKLSHLDIDDLDSYQNVFCRTKEN